MDTNLAQMPDKQLSKDSKQSIYSKYKRRIESTRHILNELIAYSELRLTDCGNIENREETDKILFAAKELRDCLPKISFDLKSEAKSFLKTYESLSNVFDLPNEMSLEDIEEILVLEKNRPI